MSDLLAKLSAPFAPATVSWRLGPTNADKTRGMALAYIDARDVQDRLDAVCGINWQARHPWASGTLIACEIGIKIDDEWIWRGDGAGEIESDIGGSGERKEQAQDMARKAAFSDSFKRAAVRWGVGRYLYDLDSPWVEIEQRGRSYIIPDRELVRLRSLLDKGSRPTPATGAAISAASSRGPSSTGETPKEKAIRIHRAMEIAAKPYVIDDIIRVNEVDLKLILAAGPKTHAALIAFAEQRKAELAKRRDGAAPADYEAGSALAKKLREGLVA